MEETGYIGENMANVLHTINDQLPKKDEEAFSLFKEDSSRVAFLLQRDLIHDTVVFHPSYELKSPTKSKQFREEGNKLFQKKEYRQSVKVYTSSIMQAPTSETFEESISKDGEDPDVECMTQLPLAVANRSAALLHIQQFEFCIKDVEMAVQSGYPADLLYKMHDRKGKCYLKLKMKKHAEESFQLALAALVNSKLDEKGLALWQTNIEKQLKQCENILDDAAPKTNMDFQLPLIKEANSTYSRLSSKAEVKYTEKVGRHLKAAISVTVGDLIAAEKPYSSVLLQDHYGKNCYHCLNTLIFSVPDHQCANILYCSDKCRRTAWDEYHNTEYRFLNLLGKDWCGTIGQLVFRTVRKQGLKSLLEFLKENKDKQVDYDQGVYNKDGVYGDDFYSVYHMVTNIKLRVPEGLSDFTVFAIYLLKLLQQCGFFAEDEHKTQADTRYNNSLVAVGGVLMRLIQGVQVNARGIVKLQFPTEFEDPKPLDIGMGLYTTIGLINHSCDPSAVAVFNGDNVTVRATRNIRKGHEISIDYGMLFYRNVRSQRGMNLSLKYSFQCVCPACKNNWPLWRDLHQDYPTWKCEECEGELNSIKTMGDKLVRCDRCNHLQDLTECMNKLTISHDLYAAAIEEALVGNIKFALEGIQGHLSLCQKYLKPPWRDLIVSQAAVRQCFRLQGNVRLMY